MEYYFQDFLEGPVGKALPSNGAGTGSVLGWGAKSYVLCGQKKKNTESEHVYTHGGFMLMYGKTSTIL